jgi:glycerol uptake facilitator protein
MLDSNQYDNLIPSETGSKSKSNFLEKKPSLSKRLCGEFIGTALLLSFGVGCNMTNFYFYQGLPGEDCGYEFGIALGTIVVLFGNLSGAHFNPVISLCFAIFRPEEFAYNDVLPYTLAQFFGAFVGCGLNMMFYSGM